MRGSWWAPGLSPIWRPSLLPRRAIGKLREQEYTFVLFVSDKRERENTEFVLSHVCGSTFLPYGTRSRCRDPATFCSTWCWWETMGEFGFLPFERGELFSEIQVVCVKFLVFDVRIRIERTIFVKIICTCCLLFKDKRQYSLLIIMKFI